MSNLKKVLSNRWDFSLYESTDGNYVIKVIFSEGQYKVDVSRFFMLTAKEIRHPHNVMKLSELSEEIRKTYPDFVTKEISKERFETMRRDIL